MHEWYPKVMSVRFGIESVTLPVIGFLGIFGNLIVIAVLIRLTTSKKENQNEKKFDRMLISLSMADLLLLIMYVVDALVQVDLYNEPQWYQVRNINLYYEICSRGALIYLKKIYP